MHVRDLTLGDLAEWQPAENITDITLVWSCGPSIGDVLPILKRWRQVHRLTLRKYCNRYAPSFEALSDFITEMKHLSYLHIAPENDHFSYKELEILRDRVNELILPRRPNFMLDISRIY
jgi:hypothetical protein